jgi:spermidine synthase
MLDQFCCREQHLMATFASAARLAPTNTYSRNISRLIAACFFLSGATGLIYEVLWARMLGLVFGATTLAVSTVLAAFMGGLALGSAVAGRRAASIQRPVRAYGLLEIGIALYALAVPFLFKLVDNLYAIIWQQFHPGFFAFSLWRFLLSSLMLLVPTALMGATLPVLSAALFRTDAAGSTSITKLYTRNLAGAICGSIAAGFFLLPNFGVRVTIYFAALINILIGVASILADRKPVTQPGNARETTTTDTAHRNETSFAAGVSEARFWMFCAFVSGFVTISTQVAWTRVLTMIVGSSTYAFSLLVALFLFGLAGGAYVMARRKSLATFRQTLLRVELLTAASILISLWITNKTPALLNNSGLRLHINSWPGLLTLQIVSVALLILLPAFLMGMVMPLVLVWAATKEKAQAVRLVGRSYAVNTLGAIAGAFVSGFLLVPKLSTRFTILFAAVLCVIVATVAYQPKAGARDPDLQRAIAAGSALLLIMLLFLIAPRMNRADLSVGAYDSLVRVLAKSRGAIEDESVPQGPEIHELLMYEEGPTSTVSVRKDWNITSMAINGRTNASDSEDMATQIMLGQLPVLLAPRVKNALVVGYATGVTAGAILQSPIESVECIELEPATVSGSRFFEHVNNHPLNDSRLHLIIDDARTYLRVVPTRYDIIVSEPSHPWVPGVANLFTREFFQLGRERLNDQGIFVQWLQIYQLSTNSLRSVLATFHETFPYVLVFRVQAAWKGKDLLLVGSNTPLDLERIQGRLQERVADPRIAAELGRANFRGEADVRAWYVCDEKQLAPAVAGTILNTDDNMHIETTAPREAFRPQLDSNGKWIEKLSAAGLR